MLTSPTSVCGALVHLLIVILVGISVEPGWLVGKSAGLVIERSRVRFPTGAAGEFSSPELTLCAVPYSVSVPTPFYGSGT